MNPVHIITVIETQLPAIKIALICLLALASLAFFLVLYAAIVVGAQSERK